MTNAPFVSKPDRHGGITTASIWIAINLYQPINRSAHIHLFMHLIECGIIPPCVHLHCRRAVAWLSMWYNCARCVSSTHISYKQMARRCGAPSGKHNQNCFPFIFVEMSAVARGKIYQWLPCDTHDTDTRCTHTTSTTTVPLINKQNVFAVFHILNDLFPL